MMYNDYEGQDPGGEWNSYSPVSNDMYMGGNGNGPQQKFGHSSLHDGPDNPFDDPFFNNFLKGCNMIFEWGVHKYFTMIN